MALTAEQRKNLPDSSFAVPGKRALPIPDADHIKLAWDMVDRTKGLSADEKKAARKKILAAAKKEGVDTSDWDKSAMTDSVFSKPEVLLDSQDAEQKEKLPPGILMRVRCRGTRADVINGHNRTYPRSVILDGLENAKGSWDPIESPHPAAYTDAQGQIQFRTSLDNRVGRIHGEPWMDSEGWVWFDADIYDTTKGRNIAAIIRAGDPVGVSLRSTGNSVRKVINDSYVSVATKMAMRTFDFVPDPATEGCGTEQIVLTDSQMHAILDGLQFNDPVCPLDGHALKPFDPDLDNDVDFWECPECKSKYDVYNGVQMNVSSNQQISRRWDSPDYGAAQAQINSAGQQPALDSHHQHQPQGDENMSHTAAQGLAPSQVQQMITDSLKPYASFIEQAEADRRAAEERREAMVFVDSKLEEIKANYPEAVLNTVRQSIGTPQNKEQAQIVLDSALQMVSQLGAANYLQAMGFSPNNPAPEGNTRTVEVTHEPKPWQPLVDGLLGEFDRISAEKGETPDPALRKQNAELVNKIVNRFEKELVGYQRMTDSMNQVEALLDSGASVTTAQLLNQPTIQTVILMQKFQDTESTQFMMSDVFEGSEWRIPSETFTTSATLDPATMLYDLIVAENSPIPEAKIDVIWASFVPQARRNAISLTTDTIRAMETGPLKYNAPARAIYHIGRDAARKVDQYAYWDMAVTADEYMPLIVTNETVTTTANSDGTNVAFKGQLKAGGKAGTTANGITYAPAGYLPVVRPRTKQVIQPNGSVQTVTTNTITVKVGGTTLTLGGLDTNGNIAIGDFAINFETGDIYFKDGLGINPGTVDPVASYSAATNYDLWSYTVGSGYNTKEEWYNTLLHQISDSGATMGSYPRFNPPNLALFSLNSSNYVRNAQLFYKLASPPATTLNPTRNWFGSRDDVNFFKLNAPTVFGDGRILLTQKNATRYGIQTPYKIEGPITKQDPSTGQILAVKAWYGEEFSCICTPQVIDKDGNIMNPTSRTIRIVP